MKLYHFYDEEEREDFYVKASSLWRANETAHYYYTRPFYIGEHDMITAYIWGWEIYEER